MPLPARAPAREGCSERRRAVAAISVGGRLSVLAILSARPRPQRAGARAGAVRGGGVISGNHSQNRRRSQSRFCVLLIIGITGCDQGMPYDYRTPSVSSSLAAHINLCRLLSYELRLDATGTHFSKYFP